MRRIRALAAGVVLVTVHPGPARGLDLPDPATLLGTGDPLAILPDSLPARGAFRSRVELRELYRYRRGDEFQDYDVWSTQTLALARTGPLWLGLRVGTEGLSIDRQDVYGERDVLRGRRSERHLAAVVAGRSRVGEFRALLGGASGPEFALRYRTPGNAEKSLAAWWWLSQGETDVSQKVRDATFFFPFRYHEQRVGTRVAWPLPRRLCGRASIEYGSVAGEETFPDQYNRLDLDRWRFGLELDGADGLPLELASSVDFARAGVEMVLSGTAYARARNLDVLRWKSEAAWRLPQSLRVAVGYDRWTASSSDPSFVDVWPFTIWDVFTGTRFRLESTEFRLGIPYVRAGWSPRLARVSWDVQATYEWWDSRGDLFWKERVATFPPFFFRFDHYVDSLRLAPTNGVQADASIRYDVASGIFARVETQLAAPFGKRRRASPAPEPDPPPPPPEPVVPGSESVRGGLRVVVSLGADW